MIPIALAATLGGGLLKNILGGGQKRKGQRLLDEIGDSPDEHIPNEVLENQTSARLRANTGLPSEQYNQAMRNIQRQQMMMLKNAGDRRGGLAVLANNQQGYNDALLNLDTTNAKQRIANEGTLYKVNNSVAGWKDKVWGNNVRDKWNRKYQYANSLIGSGNQNSANGLDQMISGGVSLLGGVSGSSGPSGKDMDAINAIGKMGLKW